jgi:thiol-disulfide isomerase/thioredoxin
MIEKPKSIHQWKLDHWKGTPMLSYEAELVRPAGTRVSSASSDGKVRVLYFWASWCGPCRKTAPMLDALYTEVGPEQLELLAVSSEERGVIEAYLLDSKTSFPIVHDVEGHFKLDYEVKKLPTIVVIDGAGSVVSWDTSVSGVRRAVQTVRSLLAS